MKSLRFSLVQLVLVTALVGILLAGYRALQRENALVTRGFCQFFPDGKRLLFSYGDKQQVWDFSQGSTGVVEFSLSQLTGLDAAMFDGSLIHPLADDRISIGARNATATEWILLDWKHRKILARCDTKISAIAGTSPNGDFYVRRLRSVPSGTDTAFEVVQLADGAVLARAASPGKHGLAARVSVSSDGRRLMWITGDDTVFEATPPNDRSIDLDARTLFHIDCRSPLSTDDPEADSTAPLAQIHHGTGRVAHWDFCRHLLVVSQRDGSECFAATLRRPDWTTSEGALWFEWSHDGDRLLCIGDGFLAVFDIGEKRLVHEWCPEVRSPWRVLDNDIRLSPDGNYLTHSSPEHVSLWDVNQDKEATVLGKSMRWRDLTVYWFALSAWAGLWGGERKRQRRSGKTPDSAWFTAKRLAHCVPPVAVLTGLVVLIASDVPSSADVWRWRFPMLAGLMSLMYFLVEIWTLCTGPRVVGAENRLTANSVPQEPPEIPTALRWSWRLAILGGIVSLGLTAFLIFIVSGTPLYMSHGLVFGGTVITTQLVPVLMLGSLLIGLLGLRLIAAGMAEETGPELDTLRRHQRWSWLYLDVVNTMLSFVEGWLVKRPAVLGFRLQAVRGAA